MNEKLNHIIKNQYILDKKLDILIDLIKPVSEHSDFVDILKQTIYNLGLLKKNKSIQDNSIQDE